MFPGHIPKVLQLGDQIVVSEYFPFQAEEDGHRCNQRCSGNGSKLYCIDIHSQEAHGVISGNGADPGTHDQTKECKDIAAYGIEGEVGGGILRGQIHVQNVAIGDIQTYIDHLLEEGVRNVEEGCFGGHTEVNKFCRNHEEHGDSEGLDPGATAQYSLPHR